MNKFHLQKDKLIIFLTALVFTGLMFIDQNYWHNVIGNSMLIVVLSVICIFIFALLTYFGIIVIKALVDVSIGLTLIIFLAQAYCSDGVVRTLNSNQALMTLISVGLLYVGFDFLYKVYHSIENHKNKFKETGWGWQEKTVYCLGVIFVVCFVVLVYMVINPTIHGLCVYK
jgi:hypothetical protein